MRNEANQATAIGTPRAAERQSARDALTPFAEGFHDDDGSPSANVYTHLDRVAHTFMACVIDLGLS